MDGWAVSADSAAIEVSEEPFQSGEEEAFQDQIEAHPEVIPITELNPSATVALPIGREVPTSVGPADLLFVDDTGRLVVIECKLIQNQEARREVVAQLLEYGSRITHEWDEQRVSAIADEYGQKHARTSLCDALNGARLRIAGGRGDVVRLSTSSLSQRIRDGLRSETKGPILVVAGNRLEQRALVLTDYLRQQRVPIACVEVRRFRVAGAKFLIGAVRAASLIATLSPSQGAALNRDEWLAVVEEEPLASIRRDLLEWAEGLEKEGLCALRFGSVALLIDAKLGLDRTVVLYDIEKPSLYTNFDTLRAAGWSDADIRQLRGEIEAIVGTGRLGAGTSFASFGLIHLASVESRNRMKDLLASVMRRIATAAAG